MTRYSKTAAFMIEMMASIVLMAICGCICLMAFVRANTTVMTSAAEISASRLLQNEAEAFKASDAVPELAEQVRFYDNEWNIVDAERKGGYVLKREIDFNGDIATLYLSVQSGKEVLCELAVKKYFPEMEGME